MKRSRAFTLIELLVVVSIIALLVSILLPALGKARAQARRVACVVNCKTIGLSSQLYADESDDWILPMISGWVPDSSDNNRIWFQNVLFTEIIEFQGRRNVEEDQGYNALTLPEDFKCPEDRRTVGNGFYQTGNTILGVSYGYNGMGSFPAPGDGWYYGFYNGLGKRGRIRRPAEKFAFMDATDWGLHMDSADYELYWDLYGDLSGAYRWHCPAYRHDEGANVVYFDGHAQYAKKTEIYIKTGDYAKDRKTNETRWLPIDGKYNQDPPQ